MSGSTVRCTYVARREFADIYMVLIDVLPFGGDIRGGGGKCRRRFLYKRRGADVAPDRPGVYDAGVRSSVLSRFDGMRMECSRYGCSSQWY